MIKSINIRISQTSWSVNCSNVKLPETFINESLISCDKQDYRRSANISFCESSNSKQCSCVKTISNNKKTRFFRTVRSHKKEEVHNWGRSIAVADKNVYWPHQFVCYSRSVPQKRVRALAQSVTLVRHKPLWISFQINSDICKGDAKHTKPKKNLQISKRRLAECVRATRVTHTMWMLKSFWSLCISFCLLILFRIYFQKFLCVDNVEEINKWDKVPSKNPKA